MRLWDSSHAWSPAAGSPTVEREAGSRIAMRECSDLAEGTFIEQLGRTRRVVQGEWSPITLMRVVLDPDYLQRGL